MKYLISPLQLGMLLQEDNKEKRAEIINDILSLYYILNTSDYTNLEDHIKLNNKERNKKHGKSN